MPANSRNIILKIYFNTISILVIKLDSLYLENLLAKR